MQNKNNNIIENAFDFDAMAKHLIYKFKMNKNIYKKKMNVWCMFLTRAYYHMTQDNKNIHKMIDEQNKNWKKDKRKKQIVQSTTKNLIHCFVIIIM